MFGIVRIMRSPKTNQSDFLIYKFSAHDKVIENNSSEDFYQQINVLCSWGFQTIV